VLLAPDIGEELRIDQHPQLSPGRRRGGFLIDCHAAPADVAAVIGGRDRHEGGEEQHEAQRRSPKKGECDRLAAGRKRAKARAVQAATPRGTAIFRRAWHCGQFASIALST
jgi:hypothetical protein